jgi:hypothetical protein
MDGRTNYVKGKSMHVRIDGTKGKKERRGRPSGHGSFFYFYPSFLYQTICLYCYPFLDCRKEWPALIRKGLRWVGYQDYRWGPYQDQRHDYQKIPVR